MERIAIEVAPEEARRQLARLLNSAQLRTAPRQQRLLRRLLDATLAGDAARLKGYTLAVEVFDQPPDFDPCASALVRVEVGRLRSKLLEYYSGEGAADPILMEVPKGGYALRLVARAAHLQPPAADAAMRWAKPSIAVLPFANLCADRAQDYFAAGITEDLITDLSKLSGLFVTSRHSSFVYRDVQRQIEDIARELGVRYLLEGSVRRAGDQVRITAQLVDASTGDHVWAERYDRSLADLLTVQDDVTQRIVQALAIQLTPLEAARVGHEGTAVSAAHDLVLRGLERLWMYTPQSNCEAQHWFRRAAEIDPEYADASAWLARSMVLDYVSRWNGSTDLTLHSARHIANEAVHQDSLLPLAHAVHGWAELWGGEHDIGIAACRRAVRLDPNNSDARIYLSVGLTLQQQADDALREIETGLRLNPQPSAFYLWAHGLALATAGRYEDALADFRAGFHLRPLFQSNFVFMLHALSKLGRLDEARHEAVKYVEKNGSPRIDAWRWLTDASELFDALTRAGLAPEGGS